MFRRGIDLKRIVVIPDEMDVRALYLLCLTNVSVL